MVPNSHLATALNFGWQCHSKLWTQPCRPVLRILADWRRFCTRVLEEGDWFQCFPFLGISLQSEVTKTLDATLPAILNILGEVLYIRFWKFAIQFFKIRTKKVNHDAVRWLKKTKSGILECCRSKSNLHSHFSWNVSRIAAVSLNAPSSWEYKTTAGLFLSELRLSFKALWWFLSEIRPSTGRDWVRFELGGLSKICYKPATIRALLMSNPGPWLTKWFHSLQSLER